MRLKGFIGPAYTLDSVNVEAQRCVNLYPQIIESSTGKEGQIAFLKSTPGLELLKVVGAGPIRLIHVDSIGRILVVSGNKLYRLARRVDWEFITVPYTDANAVVDQATGVNTGTETFTAPDSFITGEKVRVSSSNTLPTGLVAATDYWVINVSATEFRLASSLANANAGTPIDITAAGTGTMTVVSQSTLESIKTGMTIDGSIDLSTNVITKTAHGYYDGLRILIRTVGTPMPGGLDTDTPYFVIVNDANSFKLATSIANVVAGTAIDITAVVGDWAATKIREYEYGSPDDAEFTTSSGPIIARSFSLGGNGEDSTTLFTDGTLNYVLYDNNDPTFGVIFESSDAEDLLPPTQISSHIAWIDGHFIVNEVGTNKFWVSDVQSINIDALSFASSEGSPDIVMGLIENNRYLWVFNEKTTEIYANTGNADFPFERISGGFLEVGCSAKYSIAKIDSTVLWLGRSEFGDGIVYAAKGLDEQRISTHAIETAIKGYADISSATAYTYQDGGHSFYVLNFDEATWVYDMSTGLWHERAYTNAGVLERHRVEVHAYDGDSKLHIVGDYEDGNVYFFNNEYYSDNGDEITRLRSSPHVTNGRKRVFCSRFELDMETGIGLVSGQGSDPQVMLDWSNDGGHTWSDESWTSAGGQSGGIGEYSKRVFWNRLGSFRDRVFRVTMTDPVPWTLIDAHLELEGAAS